MEQCLQAVLALLVRAKYPGPGDDKAALLADVNVELEVLRFQVRLANDLVALPLNGHGHAVKLAKVLADLPFFQAEWRADHFEVKADWARVEAESPLRI